MRSSTPFFPQKVLFGLVFIRDQLERDFLNVAQGVFAKQRMFVFFFSA